MSTDVGGRRPVQRLVNIQILRGVAAVLVVIAHAVDLVEGDATLPNIRAFDNLGAAGVDIFFVISGFVMALSIESLKGRAASVTFLVRRWIRVAPPYFVATLLPVALMVAAATPIPVGALANTVLFVPWLDSAAYTNPPIDVGWTLSFEFTFYLIVAAAVCVTVKNRPLLLAAMLLVIATAGYLLPPGAPYILRWFTNPIFAEFAFGVVIFGAWQTQLLTRKRKLWLILGVAGAVTFIAEGASGYGLISEAKFTLDGSMSTERVILWGIPAAAIFAAAVASPSTGAHLPGRVARRIGDASYSIYLIHHPLLLLLGRRLSAAELSLPPLLIFLVAVAISLIAGLAFYRLVEHPLTKYLSRKYAALTKA